MRATCGTVLLLLASLLITPSAIAQQAPDAQPVAFSKWDAGATFGLQFGNDQDPGGRAGDSVAYNMDVGRYLSTHVKIDAGLMLNPLYSMPFSKRFPVAGLPSDYDYLEYAHTTVRPTSAAGAVAYQFGENALTHPYVSAGVRVVWQAEHTFREPVTATIDRVRYPIPAIDERRTTVAARPFVTVGCKSYFNERTFVRSEFLVAVGLHGYSHATLRIGAGRDF